MLMDVHPYRATTTHPLASRHDRLSVMYVITTDLLSSNTSLFIIPSHCRALQKGSRCLYMYLVWIKLLLSGFSEQGHDSRWIAGIGCTIYLRSIGVTLVSMTRRNAVVTKSPLEMISKSYGLCDPDKSSVIRVIAWSFALILSTSGGILAITLLPRIFLWRFVNTSCVVFSHVRHTSSPVQTCNAFSTVSTSPDIILLALKLTSLHKFLSLAIHQRPSCIDAHNKWL